MSGLEDFFRQDYFSSQAECDNLVSRLRKTVFDQSHKRTLWLLDGLDEISGYRHISGNDSIELFNDILSQNNVIITSRPYATNLPGLPPFDLELETIGFHPSQVQAYLAKTMEDPDITDQLNSLIRSHWLIQGLVRIPIQLDALSYGWCKGDSGFDPLPKTMTGIYQAIELKLWRKDILNLGKKENTELLSEEDVQALEISTQIERHVETEMKFLECLAFIGLYTDDIEFHKAHRHWLYKQPQFRRMSDVVLDRLSFLRTSDDSSQDTSYHFIHLTFQEFFAARYFVRHSISGSNEPLICLKRGFLGRNDTKKLSLEEFLQEGKYSGRYDVFWRFVTGLLLDIDKERESSFLSSFLGRIGQEPRDLLGPAHLRLLIHCFGEIHSPENPDNAESGDEFLRDLRSEIELGCIQWSDYENQYLEEMRLCCETEFPEHVLCELLESSLQRDGYRRERILRALANRSHMSFKLIGLVSKFMVDSDSDVRRAAVDALGRQSPCPPEILQAVTARLDDSDSTIAFEIEALLWNHDDFLYPLLHLHPDATSALFKIWTQKSICETFACYVCKGNIYFDTSDGRRSFSLSRGEIQLLKQRLRLATFSSPVLRLVYRDRSPFS